MESCPTGNLCSSESDVFGDLIINGMNGNVGRLDVIILSLDYKWDEYQYWQIGCYYFVIEL